MIAQIIYQTYPEYEPSGGLIVEGDEYNGYTLKYFNKDKIDTVYQEITMYVQKVYMIHMEN